MKIKTEKKTAATDLLITDLTAVIEKKRQHLLGVINSGLITLFWQIGKELNKLNYLIKKAEYDQFGIARYGPFFTEKNLHNMCLFAEQFPDLFAIEQFASFVTWEHILILLKLEGLEVKLFYIKLTVNEGLSVPRLRKRIFANTFEQFKIAEDKKNQRDVLSQSLKERKFIFLLQQNFKQIALSNSLIKSFFKEPLLSSFRSLMEPTKNSDKFIDKSKKSDIVKRKRSDEIIRYIEKFRHQQNEWFNTQLNLLLLEIGKRINQEINDNKNTDSKLIIGKISKRLEKIYNKLFSTNQLRKIILFAKEFDHSNIASRIAYLLSWKHIQLLLSVQEIEAMFFYANLTSSLGLNVTTLRKQITANMFEQTKGAKELVKTEILALQNPRKETQIEKKGRSVFVSTVTYIDMGGKHAISTNIFKNPFWRLLE